MIELYEQCKEQAPDHERKYLHDPVFAPDTVCFDYGSNAMMAAYILREWLIDQGYVAFHPDRNQECVQIVDVNLPDWVTIQTTSGTLELEANGIIHQCHSSDLEVHLDSLVDKLWTALGDIDGIGSQTVEELRSMHETPMDIDDPTTINGIGSTTAEMINEFNS